jgi:hypothetical protein
MRTNLRYIQMLELTAAKLRRVRWNSPGYAAARTQLDYLDEKIQCRRRMETDSIRHIRRYYGLNLNVGMAVIHDGRPGEIVGFDGQYVRVRFPGQKWHDVCHATWRMTYPPQAYSGFYGVGTGELLTAAAR